MSVLVRLVHRVWVRAVDEDLESRRKLNHGGQFGFLKGRDRAMLAVVLLGIQEHTRWVSKSKKKVWLLSRDVKGAYTGMHRDGADWELAKLGLDAGLWRLMRAMDRGLKGRIWVGSLLTESVEYAWGVNQGAGSAPLRWRWFIDKLYCLVEEAGMGVGVTIQDPPNPTKSPKISKHLNKSLKHYFFNIFPPGREL